MKYVIIALALVSGCAAPQTAPSPPTAHTPAPSSTAATGELARKLVGEWWALPPIKDRRLYRLAKLALARPPAEQAFEAMSPTDAERQIFDRVQRARNDGGDAAWLAKIEGLTAALDANRFNFTGDKLIAQGDTGTDVARYSVEDESASQLIIVEDGSGPVAARRHVIKFESDDELVISSRGGPMTMLRVTGDWDPLQLFVGDGAARGARAWKEVASQ